MAGLFCLPFPAAPVGGTASPIHTLPTVLVRLVMQSCSMDRGGSLAMLEHAAPACTSVPDVMGKAAGFHDSRLLGPCGLLIKPCCAPGCETGMS